MIPHSRGPEGHSDADVLAHAVGDALLGALADGDLGTHFPSSDERLAGMSSLVLLQRIHRRLADRGWEVENVDSTVIAQEPRLAPFLHDIRSSLAACLGTDPGNVNVKATTTDRLGFIGRGEGIAAQAVVLLKRVKLAQPGENGLPPARGDHRGG